MALSDWVQTVAIIYLAWRQNKIFERQNEIFANQAGQTTMPKTPQVLWIGRYWPTVVMAGVAALTGYDIYSRHGTAPVIPWWFYVTLLLVVAVVGLINGRLARTKQLAEDKPEKPSKLVIHSANYQAWSGQGEKFDVTQFMRKIIKGDALILSPVNNESFSIDGKNYVPKDPFFGKQKRLEVTYSFDEGIPKTIQRDENTRRLVLPEDLLIEHLQGEIEKLKATQPRPSQYPVPQLRGKIVAMVSELQGFFSQYGDEPSVSRLEVGAGIRDEEYLRRVLEIRDPWRAKFMGDYCLRFEEPIRKLRNEMRSRASVDDLDLNHNIELAAKNRNSSRTAVQAIIKRLWELALNVNA